ncbi:tick legumain-like protein, partial [Dinothrombium tinctorium]
MTLLLIKNSKGKLATIKERKPVDFQPKRIKLILTAVTMMLLLGTTFIFLLLRVNAKAIDKLAQEIDKAKEESFNGKLWAVLVAGSNGFYNYRHQADVCHSYHVLRNHGVPEENIIVMMYDDIAYSDENPLKGFIRNRPGGPNVYAGVPKDYTSEEVTPENFLAALSGDNALKAKGKKVVESSKDDHIFVYFADHGATGLIAFPTSELHSKPFNDKLLEMSKEKRFRKMVIYIEACESGSMFDGLLPPNINIYATTAANPYESSYACYDDDELDTYLGDDYSVNWLQHSDSLLSLTTETLEQQYQIVKKETQTSHVMQYGDLNMSKLPLSQFQGSKTALNATKNSACIDGVPSRDVPLIITAKKYERSEEPLKSTYKLKLDAMIAARSFFDSFMQALVENILSPFDLSPKEMFNTREPLRQHDCYETMVRTFDQSCFDISQHQPDSNPTTI